MMVIEARSNLSFAMRRRKSLISSRYSSIAQVYSRIAPGTAPALTISRKSANQRVGGDHGRDQDGNDVDHLDHRVDRRPGSVLVRVTDRVAGDGGGVRFGALATIMPIFDVLLGVVPGAATIGHLNGEKDAGHDAADQHAAEGLW